VRIDDLNSTQSFKFESSIKKTTETLDSGAGDKAQFKLGKLSSQERQKARRETAEARRAEKRQARQEAREARKAEKQKVREEAKVKAESQGVGQEGLDTGKTKRPGARKEVQEAREARRAERKEARAARRAEKRQARQEAREARRAERRAAREERRRLRQEGNQPQPAPPQNGGPVITLPGQPDGDPIPDPGTGSGSGGGSSAGPGTGTGTGTPLPSPDPGTGPVITLPGQPDGDPIPDPGTGTSPVPGTLPGEQPPPTDGGIQPEAGLQPPAVEEKEVLEEEEDGPKDNFGSYSKNFVDPGRGLYKGPRAVGFERRSVYGNVAQLYFQHAITAGVIVPDAKTGTTADFIKQLNPGGGGDLNQGLLEASIEASTSIQSRQASAYASSSGAQGSAGTVVDTKLKDAGEAIRSDLGSGTSEAGGNTSQTVDEMGEKIFNDMKAS
jgi:hypothetical protein